jgi:CRISPR-associated exonuclease Cas4
MSVGASFALPLFVVFVFLWAAWTYQHKDRWFPAALRKAELVIVEAEYETVFEGRQFIGRLDRAYQFADGSLTPMEYKTRGYFRVFETDIAELSLQAWLLRAQGMPTVEYGFVVIQHNKSRKRRSFKVRLWDSARCEAQIRRYLALRSQTATPSKNKDGKCRSCGHSAACSQANRG